MLFKVAWCIGFFATKISNNLDFSAFKNAIFVFILSASFSSASATPALSNASISMFISISAVAKILIKFPFCSVINWSIFMASIKICFISETVGRAVCSLFTSLLYLCHISAIHAIKDCFSFISILCRTKHGWFGFIFVLFLLIWHCSLSLSSRNFWIIVGKNPIRFSTRMGNLLFSTT